MCIVWSISGGCSVYSVIDRYGVNKIQYGAESLDPEVQSGGLWIDDKMRFMSIGPPGIPFIPFVLSSPTSERIAVKSTLTLRKEHLFSANARPCLLIDSTNKICPNTLSVRAKAKFPSESLKPHEPAKERWLGAIGESLDKAARREEPFGRADDMLMDLSDSANSSVERIGTEDINRYYYYAGEPRWEYLEVTFFYDYDCGGMCPKEFILDAKDYLFVDGECLVNREYYYGNKVRMKQYHFMAL
jgi:hypothetical protein